MSDCPVCGPAGEEGPCLAHSAPLLTPPTPDPRERGEANVLSPSDVRVLIAETCDLREADVVRTVERAVLAKVAALRAPAPSEVAAFTQETVDTLSKHLAWLDKEAKRADLRGGGHGQLVGHEPGAGYRKVAGAINDALHAYLATHPAPARGVTVTEAMVERAMGVECGSTHHEHHPPDCRRCWQAKLTAALTPDAEGGA